MIEELKDLLTMIEKMPQMVVHVLLGFAIYKTIIFLGTSAGIYGTIRLAINRWHDYASKKISQPKIIEHKIDNMFITADGTYSRFMALIDEMKNSTRGLGISNYVHSRDVDYLIEAIKEKKQRDKDKKGFTNV